MTGSWKPEKREGLEEIKTLISKKLAAKKDLSRGVGPREDGERESNPCPAFPQKFNFFL